MKAIMPINDVPTEDKSFRVLGIFVIVIMLGGFLLWSGIAPLKSAVVASGKIVVESRNKVIQHLDGGIVADIYVKDGEVVHKGQPLLKLSDVQLRSQLDIVTNQYWESFVSLDRLYAERDNLEALQFSSEVMAASSLPKVAQFMATQQQLFLVRRKAFHSEQAVLKQKIAQTNEQIKGLQKVINSQLSRQASLSSDVKDWEQLYQQQYADKVRMREMQRQGAELEGDIAGKLSEIARLKQLITETERQQVLRQEEYLKEVTDHIREAQSKQTESEARKIALNDQLSRVTILAPSEGRVVGFEIVTLGAVVDPRRAIMEIVPAEHQFAVIGQVQINDIDQVMTGLTAEIKFSAFNTNFLPVMYGVVESVGADAVMDEASKQAYYKVRIIPQPSAVEALSRQGWQLVSGMPADVFIQTRERTLLNYFVKPFKVMLSRAFNEDDGLKQ